MEHVREHHATSPIFGCLRSFKKFLSFKTHVYQWRGGDPNVSNNPALPVVPNSPTDPACLGTDNEGVTECPTIQSTDVPTLHSRAPICGCEL